MVICKTSQIRNCPKQKEPCLKKVRYDSGENVQPFWLNPILNILIVTRGIIHVYTITARMLCRCNASAAKNFQGSASGAILILWCTGIIMQRKGIVIFMDNQLLQIQNRTCRIYGTASAEYLLLQMVDEHDLAGMEREVEAIHRQTTQPFLLAAVQAENWNDDLSPWPAPPVWGKQGFGGRAGDTLAWLAQAVPSIRRQYSIKEDCKVVLGGYSLAGLFALWAATQNDALYGVAAASPSVWFPGWQEHEAARPIQTQRVYLSLGDREEHTKNQTMASVGDNIRALHTALTQRGTACTLEWNTGGHFKDVDLRTARAFAWTMESE